MNRTIILPYTPAPLKKFLEKKKVIMEKLSKGEEIDENLLEYAHSEMPERLRNKYKRNK